MRLYTLLVARLFSCFEIIGTFNKATVTSVAISDHFLASEGFVPLRTGILVGKSFNEVQ